MMSTYLLAYIVSEFTAVERMENMAPNKDVLVRGRARQCSPGLVSPEG